MANICTCITVPQITKASISDQATKLEPNNMHLQDLYWPYSSPS